jgi:hypothetical protein
MKKSSEHATKGKTYVSSVRILSYHEQRPTVYFTVTWKSHKESGEWQ